MYNEELEYETSVCISEIVRDTLNTLLWVDVLVEHEGDVWALSAAHHFWPELFPAEPRLDRDLIFQIMDDVCEFIRLAGDLLHDWPHNIGHDFALARQGHGAGFWDRGEGERGEALTEIAKSFGELHLWYDAESNTVMGE